MHEPMAAVFAEPVVGDFTETPGDACVLAFCDISAEEVGDHLSGSFPEQVGENGAGVLAESVDLPNVTDEQVIPHTL